MKRNAFTLAEILITLGVIGVLAAIMLPLVNTFRPDTEKAMYLKTYDELSTAIHNLANNKIFYPFEEGSAIDYSEFPFANTSSFTRDDVTYDGNNKLCKALSRFYGKESDNTCDNNTLDAPAFTSDNGTQYFISTTFNRNQHIYLTIIRIPIKNSNDHYQLFVAADGRIRVGDSTGERYLATRNDLRRGPNPLPNHEIFNMNLNDPSNTFIHYPTN